MEVLRVTNFSLQKIQSYKAGSLGSKKLNGIVWNSGLLNSSDLSNNLPSDIKVENFAKRTEKCKILGSLLDKEAENLESHSCAKVQDLVAEEMCICMSYPLRHKTTIYCTESKAKLFGNWIMQHLKL